MDENLMSDLESRMGKVHETLRKEFSGLRAGRATTSLLDPVMVDVYGSMMPLNQVGTIGAPEPRMLTVQIWDKSNAKAVEKAIRDANLGLNPQSDGNLIRIPIPTLTEERRQELVKVAAKYAEQARIAVRNIRRDGMDDIKKAEKDGDLSEDEQKVWSTKIQTLTDTYIKKIDESLEHKEKDITQV